MENKPFIFCIDEQLKEKLEQKCKLLRVEKCKDHTVYIFENKLEAVDMEFSLDDRMKMVFTNKMTF